MSNCAASGSQAPIFGVSDTEAEIRTAGRPAISNQTGSPYSTVGSAPALSSKIHSTALTLSNATASRSGSRAPEAPDIASHPPSSVGQKP